VFHEIEDGSSGEDGELASEVEVEWRNNRTQWEVKKETEGGLGQGAG